MRVIRLKNEKSYKLSALHRDCPDFRIILVPTFMDVETSQNKGVGETSTSLCGKPNPLW